MFCRVHFVFSFQLFFSSTDTFRLQRWSPQGDMLKSLASKLQVLENCPVLGSRAAVFLESLKFCRSFFVEKLVFFEIFWFCFFENTWKKIFEDIIFLFFGEHLHVFPCPRKGLSSKGLSLASDIFCVVGLEPCALNSTSVPFPFKPNVERLSPLSHISFYINFIQSTPGNTTDGAWCVACKCRLSSRVVEQFECANTLNYNLFRILIPSSKRTPILSLLYWFLPPSGLS